MTLEQIKKKSLFLLFQLQERISDLEGERDLIKENYDTLLERWELIFCNYIKTLKKYLCTYPWNQISSQHLTVRSVFHLICLYSPALFCSTLSAQNNHDGQAGKKTEVDQEREEVARDVCRNSIQRLEEMLQVERNERGRLELEKEKLRQEKEMVEEQRERERGRRFSLIAEDLTTHRTPDLHSSKH